MNPQQPKRRGNEVPVGTPGFATIDESPPSARVGDITFFALSMAGSLAGAITNTLIRQAPLFRRLMNLLGFSGFGADNAAAGRAMWRKHHAGITGPPAPAHAFSMLADAIVGNTKEAVVNVFGPPRGAAIHMETTPTDNLTYWQADLWYYPLPRNDRLAMAIEFADDLARGVEFFRAPGF